MCNADTDRETPRDQRANQGSQAAASQINEQSESGRKELSVTVFIDGVEITATVDTRATAS